MSPPSPQPPSLGETHNQVISRQQCIFGSVFSSDDNFSFQGGGGDFFNDEDFLSRLQANAESTEMDVDGVGELTHE